MFFKAKQPPQYVWDLKPDITAYELAKILCCVTNLQLGPMIVEALPPEARRHLKLKPATQETPRGKT